MRIHALLFFFFSQSALALYGGSKAAPVNYLVKLQISAKTFCQGVMIAPRKVLTAGHCIEGMGLEIRENSLLLTYYPEIVSVVLGSDKVQAKSITIAPTYFDTHGIAAEDLALIELNRPLKNAEVLPVASSTDLRVGTSVTLRTLSEVALTRIKEIRSGYAEKVVITDGTRSGVCQGDSGGALLIEKNGKKYLSGVIAAQRTGCARKNSVSYFPRHRLD